jgi:NADPH2:quinone reductase
MKAIRIHENGDSSHLIYEDVPLPEPKAGEVRVKVTATGLNFIEIYHRKGLYKIPLPMTLGSEFSGTVDQLGPGVTGFQPGDRVATSYGVGGYAEYALAPADKLVPVPQSVSLEQAAALLLQGLTAHYLATSTYPLKPGDSALIHAAAGGVGQLLVQIAKRRGARVIATVSTEEKARIARECGADEVILYTQEDFEAETRRLTGGKGVNVVYDSVGKTTFDKSLNCLMPLGYMVLYGQSSGPVTPIDPQILNQKGSLFLTRPSTGPYTATREALLQRTDDLFHWLASGELKLRIDRTFPLKDAGAAQDYMESRQPKGKVLLIPAS